MQDRRSPKEPGMTSALSRFATWVSDAAAALEGASNRLISVEDLSEGELKVLHIHCRQLAQMAKSDHSLSDSHSIEEANERHAFKRDRRKQRHASGDGTR
jgi:hypothetical protein